MEQSFAVSVAGIAAESGKILIAKRIPGGALGECWEFPGGKVEENEGDGEALIREFDEEFGITVTVGPFLARASFKHKNKLRLLRAYRVFPQSGDFILREHTEYRWVYPEEIEGLMFAPSDLKLLPELKKHLER